MSRYSLKDVHAYERAELVAMLYETTGKILKLVTYLTAGVGVVFAASCLMELGAEERCKDRAALLGTGYAYAAHTGCWLRTTSGQLLPQDDVVPVERDNRVILVPAPRKPVTE